METNISLTDLAVYKALASPVRLRIIQLLAQRSQKLCNLVKPLLHSI